MNLWLDDFRVPTTEYSWVKNYNEFTEHILIYGLPDFISFDHDLGEEESGYDCAKWLIEYCLNCNKKIPNYKVHSMNPIGKKNIEQLLENFKNKGYRNE